jgi:arginase family enzyme
VDKVVDKVGDEEVNLSIDIDSLDSGKLSNQCRRTATSTTHPPAFVPAPGTIETGGLGRTTRKLLKILTRLSQARVKIVGVNVVQFTPVCKNSTKTSATAIS